MEREQTEAYSGDEAQHSGGEAQFDGTEPVQNENAGQEQPQEIEMVQQLDDSLPAKHPIADKHDAAIKLIDAANEALKDYKPVVVENEAENDDQPAGYMSYISSAKVAVPSLNVFKAKPAHEQQVAQAAPLLKALDAIKAKIKASENDPHSYPRALEDTVAAIKAFINGWGLGSVPAYKDNLNGDNEFNSAHTALIHELSKQDENAPEGTPKAELNDEGTAYKHKAFINALESYYKEFAGLNQAAEDKPEQPSYAKQFANAASSAKNAVASRMPGMPSMSMFSRKNAATDVVDAPAEDLADDQAQEGEGAAPQL